MEGAKRVLILGRSNFTPTYTFYSFCLKLLESCFQDILVQLGLSVLFAPGREEVFLSLWFSCSSAKHLPFCSWKFLAPQFSWLGHGWVAEQEPSRISWRSGACLSPPHRSVVSITCTLVASSSGTARSAGAQDPHRGCAGLGGIRKEWEGLLRWMREQLHWSGTQTLTGLCLTLLIQQNLRYPCWHSL